MWGILKRYPAISALIFICIGVVAALYVTSYIGSNSVEGIELARLDRNESISRTKNIVSRMKEIGQWEFLRIEAEEIIDTVKRGIMWDDNLVLVYSATLRFGIDLKDVNEHNVTITHDTILAKLPKVKLLDERFVDEARTRVAREKGSSFSSSDREVLTQRAYAKIRNRNVTPAVLARARENAEIEITRFLKNFGFAVVQIEWQR